MARRRAEWFDVNNRCVDCGSPENLELDHVDQSEKVSHKVWSWAKERREAELAKCVPRCVGCHKKKSAGEHAKGANNGQSRVTESQVRIIRARVAAGEVAAAVGREFGLHKNTVYAIVQRQTWAYVD
jgi:hypothetical protein